MEKRRLKLSEGARKYIENNLTEEKVKHMFNMKEIRPIKYEDYHYLK